MTDPYDFEDEEFNSLEDELLALNRTLVMTETEALQHFKSFFDSRSRAMLQDCLFRVLYREDGIGVLEILCPNEIIQNRLSRKGLKISNTIRTCWKNVKFFSICVQKDGELSCKRFRHGGNLIEDT